METQVEPNKIEKNFSRFSSSYNLYADIQRSASKKLLKFLEPDTILLSSLPILEIGCGTGLLSEGLAECFPSHKIIFSDISSKMLHQCRSNIGKSWTDADRFEFQLIDGERISVKNNYSMIISGFTFQWFSELNSSLEKMKEALSQGGIIAFSIPVEGSFPEWEKACRRLNIPFRANTLPDALILINWFKKKGWNVKYLVEELRCIYPSAIYFFRSIKNIGAATSLDGKPLSAGQMKKLCNHMDSESESEFKITYRVLYCSLIFY